jgi:outer membrane protein assembly factor BamB
LKWKYKTHGKIFSSPLAKNGFVYIGSADGHLYAIDEKSGILKWKFKTAGAIHSSPSLLKNILYLGSADGNLHAYHLEKTK